MKIYGYESETAIFKEMGERIKAYRIISNLTQEELAQKCSISLSTLIRIEKGTDTKISNIIKILRHFDVLSNIDLLIPEKEEPFEVLFHNRRTKQRAMKRNSEAYERYKLSWKWGEDK